MLVITVATINCYTMLVLSKILDRYPNCHSYSELALEIKGRKFKILTDVFVCALQLCLCSGYMYFIANMLEQIICHQTGGRDYYGNLSGYGFCHHNDLYIGLLTIPALLVAFINSYTHNSYIATFGVYANLISKALVLGYLSKLIQKGANSSSPMVIFDLK